MTDQIVAMPRYEAYKYSGVEWLNEIPKHWQLTRLGTRFNERKHKVSDTDYPALSVTKNGILPQLANAAKTNDGNNRKLVTKGDFVINSRSDRRGSSGISDRDGSVSLINIVLEPKDITPKYCHYLLRSYSFIEEFYRMGHGIVADLWTTRYDEMKVVMMGIPPQSEQTAIANFLDQKTTQIDQAIVIKEEQIILLKERKQILIQNAVTCGLNPGAPMRDSGVEYIGEIPAHWDFNKLKYGIDIIPGFAFKSEDYSNSKEDIKLLRGINVSTNCTKWDEVAYWPKNKIKGYEAYQLKTEDLVIAMDRPWINSGIRVSTISDKDLPSLLLQRVARIRGINKLETKYLYILLSTPMFLFYFEPMLTGISVPHISTDQIGDFKCPLPPKYEQNKIINYIGNQSTKIKQSIDHQQQQIKKLKEYKTTLINSAVTGKIKVA